MKIGTIIFVAAAMLAPAKAADVKYLTKREAQEVLTALSALSGTHPIQIKQQDGTYKLVDVTFSFDTNTLLAIARDIRILRPLVEESTQAQNQLVIQWANGNKNEKGSPQVPEDKMFDYLKERDKILDSKIDMGVQHIKFSDLNPGNGANQNPIDANSISALLPILDGVE